jgi:acetyl esterase/lipase
VSSTGSVEVRSNIVYVTRDGHPLLLDAYLPKSAGKHPAALVIPGGKWVETEKDGQGDVKTAELLAQQGIAAFSVQYRPDTVAPFPAQLQDVQAAVRWIRANAARYDVDPTQIGAIGASAGGHLAMLLATYGRGPLDRGSRIAVAVSWSGPTDLVRFLDETRTDVRATVTDLVGCPAGSACTAEARKASPSTYVDPSDAPIYLANSTEEVIPLEQATEMAGLLKQAGVPYVLREVEGRNHGFGYAMSEKEFVPSLSFFEQWVDGTPGGGSVGPIEGTGGSGSKGEPPPSPAVSEPGIPSKAGGSRETRPTSSNLDPLLVIIAAAALVAAVAAMIVALAVFRRLRTQPGPPRSAGADRERDREEERIG